MQTLISNKEKILEIKKKVEEKDTSLYNHLEIQNIPINEETISIVMTASNRSKQTYFTLKTIQNSMHKAVQVIIVDDSNTDPIVKEELEKYPFYIDFITIKKENKNWVNPVVNYNIGFQYIKSTKIIIQNAEVCHIGDVLSYMNSQMMIDNYYICDVRASNSIGTNDIIYQYNTNNIDIYNSHELFNMWYQGRERIVNYHFLSAMTIDTFNKIKNFSYDYTMGISFDDDDFLLKIIANKIKIINLFYDEFHFGGIHLWHSSNIKKIRKKIETNQNIFNKKKQNYEETGEYIEIINNIPENRKDEKLNIELNNKINLLELQNLILQIEGEKFINFYINKKNISYSINSFRKCYLKGYCYKNSGLKIPKNLNIKFYYI
jgi:hypothetical protein